MLHTDGGQGHPVNTQIVEQHQINDRGEHRPPRGETHIALWGAEQQSRIDRCDHQHRHAQYQGISHVDLAAHMKGLGEFQRVPTGMMSTENAEQAPRQPVDPHRGVIHIAQQHHQDAKLDLAQIAQVHRHQNNLRHDVQPGKPVAAYQRLQISGPSTHSRELKALQRSR